MVVRTGALRIIIGYYSPHTEIDEGHVIAELLISAMLVNFIVESCAEGKGSGQYVLQICGRYGHVGASEHELIFGGRG